MLGVIVLCLATWALLRYEGKSMTAIGLDRPRLRLWEFVFGFVLYGAMQAVRYLVGAKLVDFEWTIVPDYGLAALAEVMWVLTKAVLTEELFFRGYLLLLAIRWFGPHRGVFLSAAGFGVYHWISYEVLGDPFSMAWVFLQTGAAGLLFGYAFVRSGSIVMPIGLHMGTNVITAVVFSDGPWGAQWLMPSQPGTDPGFLVSFSLNFLWPVVYTLIFAWALVRFYEPATPPDDALDDEEPTPTASPDSDSAT